MDKAESVDQFHAGGTSVAGMLAVYDLSARALDVLLPEGGRLLDLGVGSGRALGRFLAMRPDVQATGVDLAPNMLATARRFLDSEGVGSRATLVQGDITSLPDDIVNEKWDAVSCVWTLHHLPDREVLGAALRQIAEIRERHRSAVWVFDFQRLRDPRTAQDLLAIAQPGMPPVLHEDALASEAAAFTHEELRAELSRAGLADLQSGLARPIPYFQAFWFHGHNHTGRVQPRRRPERLRGPARTDSILLRYGFSRLPR